MKILFTIIGCVVLLPIIIALVIGLSVAVLGGLLSLFAELFLWIAVAALVVIGIIWLVKKIL